MTQAPLTNTVGDFWRMVWEQRVGSVVVMATEEEERWWPQGQGASQRHSLVIGRSWAEGKCMIIIVHPSAALIWDDKMDTVHVLEKIFCIAVNKILDIRNAW